MTGHRDQHLELCAGYVLDTLDPADRLELEAHLATGCRECAAELRRLTGTVEQIAQSAPPLVAPADLRARVRAAVRADMAAASRAATSAGPQRPARKVLAFRMSWVWAAAAAVLLVVSVFEWRTLSRLERDLATSRAERGRLESQLGDERRWGAIATSPGAKHVTLLPTPQGSASLVASVAYDPASRRALVTCENFTAPAGRDYELWAIRASGPESLGLVRADAEGHAQIRIPDAGDPATLGAFAVSLEARGGAPTPHAPAGPVVMVGKLGS